MSYDGNGNYSLPGGINPVVPGTTIATAWANQSLADIAAALSNALCKDGQSTPTANLKMGGFKFTNLGVGSAANDSATVGQIQGAAASWLGSISGADTITASGTPLVSSYVAGQCFRFVSAGANTGPVTLNIDGVGAKAVTKSGAVALAAGDIPSGAVCEAVYDGTQFQLIGVVGGGDINLAAGKVIKFEGATDDVFETTLSGGDPTADRTLTLPDRSGTLATADEQIQPITASVAANALTVSLNPTTLAFRSSTLGSGTVNVRSIPSQISVVVPSGATLGTVSAIASRLVLIAIDNAGTVELAVTNLAGGTNLDETGVISTTAISAGATSATAVYSATARSNVPYRVVGFVDSTQATAGSWATAPSTIQGAGGNALTSMQSLGYGQKWTNLTGTRAYGVTYYNTTGRPIAVASWGSNTGTSAALQLRVDGVSDIAISAVSDSTANTGIAYSVHGIVPPGSSYNIIGSNMNLGAWFELR